MLRVGNTSQFEYVWNTLNVKEGTYTLVVTGTFIKLTNGAPSNVPTGARTVSVKHGYKIVRDLAKSFAKAISPTEGQVIPVGGNFEVSSSHQLTYERFDDCGTYGVTYEFRNSNTYNGRHNPFYSTPVSRELPKRLGEFVLDTITLTAEHTNTGGRFGFFLVEAFTSADEDRGGMYSSRDAHNFSMPQP